MFRTEREFTAVNLCAFEDNEILALNFMKGKIGNESIYEGEQFLWSLYGVGD